MSYAQKLKAIAERKQKLVTEENKLIEQRKKEIGTLAEKLGLLDCSDEDLITALQSLKKKTAAKAQDKTWKMKAVKPNQTQHKLKRIRAQINRLALTYARLRTMDRKQDTRQKIQLGGLVKKAGLEQEATAILYGCLLEIKEKLNGTQAEDYRQYWGKKGHAALSVE